MGFKPVKKTSPRVLFPTRVHIGFLPLLDAAPVIVAKEMGFFKKYGLDVCLIREDDWKVLHHRMADKEIDAAHAPVGMAFGLKLGLGGSLPMSVFTALATGLQGNAVFLARALVEQGVRGVAALKEGIGKGVFLSRRGKGKPLFGFASPFSAHYYLLRRWLEEGGLDPRRDVLWEHLLPGEMAHAIGNGQIDGFCLGEPWGALTREEGV